MGKNSPILTGGGPVHQTIYEVSAQRLHELGARGQLSDGPVYYYARSTGAAIAKGTLLQSAAPETDIQNRQPADIVEKGDRDVVVVANAARATFEDEFRGSYLIVNNESGEGERYRIEGNPESANTLVTLRLAEDVRERLLTASRVCIQKHASADVVTAAAGHVHNAAGVSNVNVPAASPDAPQYFWMQTWGIVSALDGAAAPVGAALESGAAGGQFAINDGSAQAVGTQLVTGVATEFRPKSLTIAP